MFSRKLAILGVCLGMFGCGGGDLPQLTSVPLNDPVIEARLGQNVEYVEAPSVPGFPKSESVLDDFLIRGDEAAIRSHAWSAWDSMTATAPSGLPTMLTWYTNAEIFGEGTIATPRLFLPTILTGPEDNFGNGDPPTEINFYNQAYRTHVRAQNYEWRETLQFLQGLGQTNVADFPSDAIAVKTVWFPVRHDGLTAFPVWDDELTRPREWGTGIGKLVDSGYFGPLTPEQQDEYKSHERDGNEWGTFARVVAVDPTSQRSGTAQVRFFDPQDLSYQTDANREAAIVPLQSFYTLRLSDAATVESLNEGVIGQMVRRFWGRSLTEQDSLALVAVHITTRETENWVWATFWWHDGPPQPDRPAFPGPFQNFRMAATLSADLPAAEDGGPNVTFNPYLEAGFAEGTVSNCMGCHQRAGWTAAGPQSVMPVHRGTITDGDPAFDGLLRTHFLWSLVFRPRPQQPATPPLPPDDHVPEP